jgi:hypothetical protein
MAYIITNGVAGNQPIATTSTVQNHPFGKIVTARDPDRGEGEFIYLKGVGSTVVGSWVTYNSDDWTTALIVPNAIGPVAIAMSVNDATTDFGWYQIQGKAVAKSADVADNAKVYIDTAAGFCDDAVVTGDRVTGATWASTDDTATGTADVEISRPFVTDQKDAT